MIRYLIAAALIFAAVILYVMGQTAYSGLLIAGLACEMGAIAIATRSSKKTAE